MSKRGGSYTSLSDLNKEIDKIKSRVKIANGIHCKQ